MGQAGAPTIKAAETDLKSGSDEYKAARARGGYAAEGPFMSLKQMSTQILSVSTDQQPKYIDLQRMRARQIWTRSNTASSTPMSYCAGASLSAKKN